jgi:dihydrodipicolinate reductase
MFGKGSLKIPPHILEKAKVAAEISGASSIDEFVSQIIETEADRVIASTGSKEASADEVEDIAQKLKGLGYLE